MFNLKFWRKSTRKTISEIAEENHRQHREFLAAIGWQTLGSEPDMVLVYTDKDGNNYYIARNSWQGISRDRLAALEAATLAMEYRMSREQLLENQMAIMQFFQQCQAGSMQAAAEGYKKAWEMYEIMRLAPSEAILMEYAVHVIFTDQENPQSISPALMQMKRDRASVDVGLKAFFLDMALHTVQNSLPTSAQGSLHSSPPKQQTAEGQKIRQNRARILNGLRNSTTPLKQKKPQ